MAESSGRPAKSSNFRQVAKKNGRQGKRNRKQTAPEHERCCMCDKKATTEYEEMPSCGSPACELEMQAGLDFNAECGNR